MNLEGLNAILTKEEVIATQTAKALLERPREVEGAYKAHVRTYIPLHAGRGESRISVKEFCQRLIRQTKDELAPRGYLTADFGYGKTSTALYLWAEAQQANLVAVPPFQLTRLPSFIVATYGWMNYVLSRSRPGLQEEAKAIYDAFAERSLQKMAEESGADPDTLHQWLQDGRLTLDLTAPDYIRFFEQMTALAHQAGFEGLLVLADEIQQYIEPEVKSGAKDPIAPLFNVIQGLATRRQHLAFGLILIIPRKEIAVIIDQRGDFIDRMRGLALDLGAIYNQTFPARLWARLAKEFQFLDHADSMVLPETLAALGQISVRENLSNGPRTVINAFRRIARRYLEQPEAGPYSPVDLVGDFLNGSIQFDGVKRLQEVTTRVLGHSLVRERPDREEAVKLAAAFPEDGATREVQGQLAPVFDDLLQSAQGELVIRVGDVRNPGITLLGLERGQVPADWLTLTVREFSRTYYESAEKTTQRAMEAFLDMLVSHIFRSGQWKVNQRLKSRLTQNAGLVLEGAFPSVARHFPERRIHVRVLMEDEPVKDANPLGEVIIEFRLRRYLDWKEESRRHHAEPVELDFDTHTAHFTLNLMSRSIGVSRELDEAIGKIVSPFKLTPLLLLTLHEVINEKRRDHQIPKTEDQFVQYQFQPALFDNSMVELLRPEVGGAFDAAEARLIEMVVNQLLESRYGDDYHTLMAVSTWQNSINKYINALHRLDSLPEKQGQVNVEGLKEDIADLFTLSNTGLDSFMANFPSLIEQVRDFPSRREAEQGDIGVVRFQLHPLEAQIRAWLQASPDTATIESAGKTHTLHRVPIGHIYTQAANLGYKDSEVDTLLEVMEARGLAERDRRGYLQEALRQAPSVDEVAQSIQELKTGISALQEAFPQAREFQRLAEETDKYEAKIEELRQTIDEVVLIKLRRTVETRLHDVSAAAQGRQSELKQKASNLLRRLPSFDPHRRDKLEGPVAGVKYADQVNSLRIRLLRDYTRFGTQVGEFRHQIETVGRALAEENLPLPDLATQATNLRDLDQQFTGIDKTSKALEEQYHHFTEWSRLVAEGARLFDEMQKLGDPAKDLMTAFDKLSRDIRGDISANALQALPRVTTYASQLNELWEQVRDLRVQAVETFNSLQSRYRDELVRTIDYPRDRLWDPLIYSTIDPVGVYQQLYSRVSSTLVNVIDRMQEFQSDYRSGIHNLLNTPRLADLPPREREHIEQQGHKLEATLEQVGNALARSRNDAMDTNLVRDFPISAMGAFREFLEELKELYGQLDSVRQGLEVITATLRRQALGSEETQLWNALKKVASDGGFVDLIGLRTEARKMDAEELWLALRGLWEKQRIQIQIRSVRYEEE